LAAPALAKEEREGSEGDNLDRDSVSLPAVTVRIYIEIYIITVLYKKLMLCPFFSFFEGGIKLGRRRQRRVEANDAEDGDALGGRLTRQAARGLIGNNKQVSPRSAIFGGCDVL